MEQNLGGDKGQLAAQPKRRVILRRHGLLMENTMVATAQNPSRMVLHSAETEG